MNQFYGKYYDGNTSASHEVLFYIQPSSKEISFFFKETICTWDLTSTNIEISKRSVNISKQENDELIVFNNTSEIVPLLKNISPKSTYDNLLSAKLSTHLVILVLIVGALFLGNKYLLPP